MFPLNSFILVVDDMASIRDLVKNQLKAMGYLDVKEAEDGAQAWNLIETQWAQARPFDLVISDWNMPNLKGLDLLKKVRAHEGMKTLPFVLLTSEAEREQVTEAVMSGVSQYIIKPFSGKMFEDKLATAYLKHFKKPS